MILNWVWYQWKVAQCCMYLEVTFRIMNVEEINRRQITILVHINCLYLRRWEMIHTTHIFSPRKGLLQRSLPQHPTGLDSPPNTIWVYVYGQATYSHEQTIHFMRKPPINNKITFFDGNDIHFDERALSYTEDQKYNSSSWIKVSPSTTTTTKMGPIKNSSKFIMVLRSTRCLSMRPTFFTPPH